jgi:hypothetical protein
MLSREHNGHATDPNHSAEQATAAGEVPETNPAVNEAVTVAATVGVVAVGVALFEVALLPGMAIGVAAMLAPKYVPKMGAALQPMWARRGDWKGFVAQIYYPRTRGPGSETWKDKNNAWQTGGAAVWVTGTYDPDTNQTIWGTGNPVPMFDPTYRPGDNLYTNSAISWNPDTGAMNWYFQYTPGDLWDYDEVGTHILIDGVIAGQSRKLVTHSARNGFLYTMDRFNGQTVLAKPYMNVNWTKGIDQKTGKPIDYDPARDIQSYSGIANQSPNDPTKKVCPSNFGGNNYYPSSYSPRTRLVYIPAMSNCVDVTIDTEKHNKEKGWNGGVVKTTDRYESDLTAVDPLTGEIKATTHLRYANYSGTLVTGGGLVFLGLTDGTFAAFDDITLDQLWSVNIGSGFSAAHDLSGGRQAVRGDCFRPEPAGTAQERQFTRIERATPRRSALRIRDVVRRAATDVGKRDRFSHACEGQHYSQRRNGDDIFRRFHSLSRGDRIAA